MAFCVFERQAYAEDPFGKQLLREANAEGRPVAHNDSDGVDYAIATLDSRDERQILPHSSTPLKLGETAIGGEFFCEEEVLAYSAGDQGGELYTIWDAGRRLRSNVTLAHLKAFWQKWFASWDFPNIEGDAWTGALANGNSVIRHAVTIRKQNQ